MKNEKSSHPEFLSPKENEIDLSTALVINGKSLEPRPVNHSVPVERKFKSEKEFNELVVNNSKMLFGKDTVLIDATKSPLECYVLIDYREVDKHILHFVDITLSKQSFWELFTRITRLFTLMNLPDYPNWLTEILMGLVSENKPLKKELNFLMGNDIAEYLKMILSSKPFIILLTDQERPELIEIAMTYSSNWGRYVKPILLKKYADNGDLFCTMTPAFADVNFNLNGKHGRNGNTPTINPERRLKSTEADHLENVSDTIRSIYERIKSNLLIEDAGIEFNPKQYYVSMRKNRNLAFFHIGKKRISLVVMCPEKDTKKQIKHHEVKTLTEKVQKFWNGPSCTIVIDSMDELEEVTSLLKKLIKE
jgi:predicted transport protein